MIAAAPGLLLLAVVFLPAPAVISAAVMYATCGLVWHELHRRARPDRVRVRLHKSR